MELQIEMIEYVSQCIFNVVSKGLLINRQRYHLASAVRPIQLLNPVLAKLGVRLLSA